MANLRRIPAREWWSYAVWGAAGLAIGIPEISAGLFGDKLPWTTISGMVGELEYRWNWVALIVIALIVFGLYNTLRHPPWKSTAAFGHHVVRLTHYGRLTTSGTPPALSSGRWLAGRPPAPVPFFVRGWGLLASGVAVLASLIVIAVAGFAAATWWPDPSHQHAGYVIYGLTALFLIVVPSFFAFFLGKDAPFYTLFGTVAALERHLRALKRGPTWWRAILASVVPYSIAAGLAILILHLTLYPFPNVSRILDPTDNGTKACDIDNPHPPPGQHADCP